MKIDVSKKNQNKNSNNPEKNKPSAQKRRVLAKTNRKPNLVEKGLMKAHNFMSSTHETHKSIYPLKPIKKNIYEVEKEPVAMSAILKLTIRTNETNPLSIDWPNALWDITQRPNLLGEDVLVTFTRHFERVDDEVASKRIKNRRRLGLFSSEHEDNLRAQGAFIRHDGDLVRALDTGDSVVSFGGEAIITAPDEYTLEAAVDAVQNYLKANDETRGLTYELDINKQLQPFVLYGPNPANKNKDVYMEMTSTDAAISSLFVDSGGDRSRHSEYVGLSVGKIIRSHAAYSLQNDRTMLIGNDTNNKTYTLSKDTMPEERHNLPSQVYWSQAISRSYLLDGKSVTHFVLDHSDNVDHLMQFPLNDENKIVVDVAEGFLNIIEVIGDAEETKNPERIVGRFNTHLDNIIALLSQYRDVERVKTTDDFATASREILTNFFIANKFYTHNPLENLDDIRLIGRHDQYKTLADLGAWVTQQRHSKSQSSHLKDALAELDTIINSQILPTIPALNTTTKPIIDDLLDINYKVVDLTGLSIGAIMSRDNSTTNVMIISYLNLLLPTLKNGDVIFLHGVSHIEGIIETVQDMIENSRVQVDVVYTESNQNKGKRAHRIVDEGLDFVVVDLYQNRVDELINIFDIDKGYAETLKNREGAFFVKTDLATDYIYLDDIL